MFYLLKLHSYPPGHTLHSRMARILSLFVISVSLVIALAKPTDTESAKKRVHEEQKLSDVEHDLEGEHNPDYDHEAFLGKDEAKTFDQLSPEESRNRLR